MDYKNHIEVIEFDTALTFYEDFNAIFEISAIKFLSN